MCPTACRSRTSPSVTKDVKHPANRRLARLGGGCFTQAPHGSQNFLMATTSCHHLTAAACLTHTGHTDINVHSPQGSCSSTLGKQAPAPMLPCTHARSPCACRRAQPPCRRPRHQPRTSAAHARCAQAASSRGGARRPWACNTHAHERRCMVDVCMCK